MQMEMVLDDVVTVAADVNDGDVVVIVAVVDECSLWVSWHCYCPLHFDVFFNFAFLKFIYAYMYIYILFLLYILF